MGIIDDLPDEELLNVTEALDFFVLHDKYKKYIDLAWLERKVNFAGLKAIFKRLVDFKRSQTL